MKEMKITAKTTRGTEFTLTANRHGMEVDIPAAGIKRMAVDAITHEGQEVLRGMDYRNDEILYITYKKDTARFIEDWKAELEETAKHEVEVGYHDENMEYHVVTVDIREIETAVKEYGEQIRREVERKLALAEKRENREKEKEENLEALKNKARETGKKVFYQKHFDACDGTAECDMDEIVEFVLPNGEIERNRYHLS